MNVLYATVSNVVAYVVRQFSVAGNLQQAVFESFVGEILIVFRVHHAHAIDDETIWIHIGRSRPECYRP